MIKVGDVVRLKLGGPPMTVFKDLGKGEYFLCKWFDGVDHHVETLAAAKLEKVEPATNAEPDGVF